MDLFQRYFQAFNIGGICAWRNLALSKANTLWIDFALPLCPGIMLITMSFGKLPCGDCPKIYREGKID